MAVVCALGAAICWGVSDFLGGFKSRQLSPLIVLASLETVGFLTALAVAIVTGAAVPELGAIAPAALAGCAGACALFALYRAMAVGAISIAAPISASGAALPVVYGLALGERPSALKLAGIAAALVGIILCSLEREDVTNPAGRRWANGVGLALVAALGVGLFFIGIAEAGDADVFWVLAIARAAPLLPLALLIVVNREQLPSMREQGATLSLLGVLDVSAMGLFVLAANEGLLSLASALGALYPVVTVLLARAILREELTSWQQFGVVAALVGVVAISGG